LPKQLLPIAGKDSMIRQTFDRLEGLVPPSRVWVVAGSKHVARIRKQIPELLKSHVVGEPCGRNTAPCVALAAFLMRKEPEAVMFVLPADHVIRNRRQFHRSLRAGAELAQRRDALVTFGIAPTFAATGYGYLELDSKSGETRNGVTCNRLRRFVEKPDRATAQKYASSGNFLWTSGMFVWKVGTILESFQKHLPETYRRLAQVDWEHPRVAAAQLERLYPRLEATSVDFGIMERADNIYAVRATFDWSDVGSWDTVSALLPRDSAGNASRGSLVAIDAERLLVDAGEKLVAAVGVKDLIIIDSGDALLVCDASRAQDVKKIVDHLKSKGLSRYL
jgi:mannose-1-phosphate guanylyltransferase